MQGHHDYHINKIIANVYPHILNINFVLKVRKMMQISSNEMAEELDFSNIIFFLLIFFFPTFPCHLFLRTVLNFLYLFVCLGGLHFRVKGLLLMHIWNRVFLFLVGYYYS
jgi:hypothetical protein